MPWVVAIAAQICSVLVVAHARLLIHRDLKPGNLLFCPDGTVKVLDFGIVAALDDTGTRITRTGVVLGTPGYMAPEQLQAGPVGPHTDLYALGVLMDTMLAGLNQFEGPNMATTMNNMLTQDPVPLRRRRPEVPELLESLVLWLLAKRPDGRPLSAELVFDHLRRLCGMLPPFPVYVTTPTPNPLRMYAEIVARIGT